MGTIFMLVVITGIFIITPVSLVFEACTCYQVSKLLSTEQGKMVSVGFLYLLMQNKATITIRKLPLDISLRK